MPNLHTSPETFSEAYTAWVNAILENLNVLKQLLERDYLLNEPESDAYLKICSILLVEGCRFLAEATSPEFGCESGPVTNDDLHHKWSGPLFAPSSRNIVRFEPTSDPERGPWTDIRPHVERIHSVGEDLLFSAARSCKTSTHTKLQESQGELVDLLSNHAVMLPEWHRLCVVTVDSAGDAQWSFIRVGVLRCSGSGRSRTRDRDRVLKGRLVGESPAGPINTHAFALLPTRDRNALLRLNEFAWRAAGKARPPRFSDLMAAMKAIRHLSKREERRTLYFSGQPGFRAAVDTLGRRYSLLALNEDTDELDPARFIRHGKAGSMLLQAAIVQQALDRRK